MMSVENGSYVTLSRVGARIWELIDEPIAVSTLCARLIGEFDVQPEVCEAEVNAFLAELKDCGGATLSD